MNEEKFKDLLKAYQEGRLDEASRQQVEAWYASFGYGTDIAPLEDKENAKRIYQELARELEAYTQTAYAKKITKLWWFYGVAACILAVVALGGIFGYFQDYRTPLSQIHTAQQATFYTVRTEAGKLKKLVLPDNSQVWLNANSQLRFAGQAFGKKRELFLDRGEVFLEVTTDPGRPFEVYTDGMRTEVLGTSFSVKNYRELGYAAVLVKTGRVRVRSQSHPGSNTLVAGTGIRLDKASGSFSREDHFATEADSWVKGVNLLNEATFDELALVLYNRFRVRLHTTLPQAADFRYTISIKQDKSLDETLRLISAVHQTHYRRNGDDIIIY